MFLEPPYLGLKGEAGALVTALLFKPLLRLEQEIEHLARVLLPPELLLRLLRRRAMGRPCCGRCRPLAAPRACEA